CYYDVSRCLSPTPIVVATFMTGTGPDTKAPTFAGIQSVQAGGAFTCTNDACCGQYTIVTVSPQFAPATDGNGNDRIAYNIYSGTSLVDPLSGPDYGWFLCAGGSFTGSGPYGWYRAYAPDMRVEAVDMAGNADGNLVMATAAIQCPTGNGGSG